MMTMFLSRAGALFLSLCLAAPGDAALPSLPPEASVSAAARPLSRAQQALLVRNKYAIHPDGGVVAPDGRPIGEAEMPYLLTRMGGAQRLKAFVQLDILLTNSDGERHLTPAEREQLRKIVRDNWPFFSLTTRKDFRNYFSVQELEEMNVDPPVSDEDDAPFSGMKDPEPAIAQDAAPALPEPRLAAAAPQSAVFFPQVLQPLSRPAPRLPPPPEIPAAPPAPAAAPTIIEKSAPATVVPAPKPAPAAPPVVVAPAVAAPAPTPVAAVPKEAPPPAATAAAPVGPATNPVGSSQLQAAPGVAALLGKTPAVPAAPAFKPILPTVAVTPTKPRAIATAAFDKFLVEAPYGREEKALLKIIADKAPEFARDRALAVVLDVLPQIVDDSLRAGYERRSALLIYETEKEKSYTIALNPSAVLYARKAMFFGATMAVLPDAPKAYGAMHVGAPPLEAIKHDAVPIKQEAGDWGQTKIFPDESERAAYTQVELAGALLRSLLQLDAHRQGWDGSPYAAEVYARTAQMLLYARVFGELHEDAFLDPDLRAQFRLWLDHPWEYRDFLVHALSAGRVGALDPRKGGGEAHAEFASAAQNTCPGSAADEAAAKAAAERDLDAKAALALARMGLIDDKQLENAQAEISSQPSLPAAPSDECAQRWLDEGRGAKQAVGLKSEMELADRKFREGRSDVSK